jgi:hypothetical protein
MTKVDQLEIQHWIDRWKKLKPSIVRDAVIKMWSETKIVELSDMESDGVYFPEEIKIKLREIREELNCEYSGLPSVKFYEK